MSDDDRDVESDADKRAHHNALERRRRDHIKDSFSSLRESLPSMGSGKTSRAQVLKKAAEHIQNMRRKNFAHQQNIEDLRKQNKILEDQIRKIEKARAKGRYSSVNSNETAWQSESESSGTDGSNDSQRKKLKISVKDEYV